MRLLLILISLCLAVPAMAQQPQGEISVQTTGATDALMQSRITEILAQLDGYGDIFVAVQDGIVTLDGTALDAAQIAALTELVGRVEGVVAIENNVSETTDVVERLNPAVERIRDRALQLAALSPLLLVAFGAGFALFLAGLFFARARQPWNRLAPNRFIADIYRQIIRLLFAVAGIVLALDLLGATALLGTFLGAAGIVGLAIGFAVRDTVENFIASVMLSVRQPFRPKDLVEIEGDMGHVIRLTSRATILLSLDGNHIRIPNSTVFKARIVNFTRNDERRFTFDLGVAADADIAEAQRIILDALHELPFLLETPGPAVWVNALGDSSTSITGAGWILQHETSITMAKGEAIRIAKARLEATGITLPEPTFRLITDGAAATTARPVPTPVAVQDFGAPEAGELEAMVEAEREEFEELGEGDLLAREAPQE